MPKRPDPVPIVAEVVWRPETNPDAYRRLLGILFDPGATGAATAPVYGQPPATPDVVERSA